MQRTLKISVLFFFTVAMAFVFQLRGTDALAQSSYFTSQGCSGCHAAPVVASCNGCHAHGTHPSSAKSSVNVAGTANKASYAPGETVTVTMTGGYRTGWFRATLFDQDGVTELARSNGNDSGMGNSATYPATLTHAAPATPGTYTWVIAWYGNKYDASGAAFGAQWATDPSNTNHGWEKVNLTSFTVSAPPPAGDTTAPVVGTFVLPATSASLTIPVTTFAATDNVAVTGYLVTTSATAPTAGAAGWTATAPTSVTAAAAGSVTFYAWAKDAAGNVSLSKSAGVTVTISTVTIPVLTISSLADGAYTNNATLNVSGSATDPDGIKSVTVNGNAVTVNPDGSFSTAVTLIAGANIITVVATDTVGTTKSDIRTITYDATAPVLTVTAPADNSTTTSSFATVTGSVNETSTVTVSDNSGSPQTASMTGNNFTASVNLTVGINTISITATDLAGNIFNAKRTVTYTPSSNLSLAVTNPDHDITTNMPSLMLKGTVTDATGKVTVKISMDGRTYSPKVRNGAFQQRLNFASGSGMDHKKIKPAASKQFAINVTATDGAGNSGTVTRNVIYTSKSHGGDDGNGGGGGGTTSHPFGWTDPKSSHPDYVEKNGTSSCVSCHSIDPSSKGQSMSCYNCHDKKW